MTSKNPKVSRIIEKYGPGFDVIYFDGRADERAERYIDSARKLLANGVDEEIISKSLDIPIDEIKKLKRKL